MLDVPERMSDPHLAFSHQHLGIRSPITCLQLLSNRLRKRPLDASALGCLRANPESRTSSASCRITDLVNAGPVVLVVADILQFVPLLAAINIGIRIVTEAVSKIRVAYDGHHDVHALIKHHLQIFSARETGISASLLAH